MREIDKFRAKNHKESNFLFNGKRKKTKWTKKNPVSKMYVVVVFMSHSIFFEEGVQK
mgnify:CR=1 FL=1